MFLWWGFPTQWHAFSVWFKFDALLHPWLSWSLAACRVEHALSVMLVAAVQLVSRLQDFFGLRARWLRCRSSVAGSTLAAGVEHWVCCSRGVSSQRGMQAISGSLMQYYHFDDKTIIYIIFINWTYILCVKINNIHFCWGRGRRYFALSIVFNPWESSIRKYYRFTAPKQANESTM